jgi:hypothetical protein
MQYFTAPNGHERTASHMVEGCSESGASAGNPLVYRPEALDAHRRAREFASASLFMSSRRLALLWAASLASLTFIIVLAAFPVPAHVSGTAVVLPTARVSGAGGEGLQLVAFFPPAAHARLASGQRLLVDVGDHGPHLVSRLTNVYPSVLGPEAAVERFGMKGRAGLGLQGPAACAFAVFTPPETGRAPEDWPGSTFRVEVEVGQQRLLAVPTAIARFLKE